MIRDPGIYSFLPRIYVTIFNRRIDETQRHQSRCILGLHRVFQRYAQTVPQTHDLITLDLLRSQSITAEQSFYNADGAAGPLTPDAPTTNTTAICQWYFHDNVIEPKTDCLPCAC